MTGAHFVIVELSKDGKQMKSSLWDASEPIGLGYPFRYILEKTETGMRFRNLAKKTVREFTGTDLKEETLHLRIHPVRQQDLGLSWNSAVIHSHSFDDTEENRTFKKSFLVTLGFLFTLLVVSIFVPKSSTHEEELVPAQYAKIIMSPPAPRGNSQSQSKALEQAEERKIIRSGNVVNAFKTEAVQKSTQKLMVGGALAALAKSNLLSDRPIPNSVKTLFKSGLSSSKLTALAPLAVGPQNTTIGILGGKKGEAGGTGYAEGQHLSVQGQGKSFVKLENMDSTVEEGLSKDEVGQVIHSHLAEIRYCYESAMIRKPDIQGKLILDFVIHGKVTPGAVKSADIHSSTLDDSSFDQCIMSRLLKWKFPKPKGGVDVAVSYPFIFKSLGK